MKLKEYQKIIEKTAVFPKKQIGLAYCGLGLTGEAGEVAEKIKKLYRDHNLGEYRSFKDWFTHNNELQFVKDYKKDIVKELGDCFWYCTAIANEIGVSIEEVMEANYNKLIKRRETNTLHGSGDNREEV